MTFDASQLFAYLPMLILIGMGCVLLLAETFATAQTRRGLAWLGVGGCLAAFVALVMQWGDVVHPISHFEDMLIVDRMSLYLDATFLVAATLTLLFAPAYLHEQGFEFGEFYAIVLFGTAGMMMVAHAGGFVMLLIGIETMSLAAYILTGCWRRNLRSSEGAMKYFLIGAFATGFLVYGMALVYGTTGGSLTYYAIAAKIPEASKSPLFFFGEYFILIALFFKVAAVPFHMWTPDTYQGAPTPVTGFMAAGVKAAAFAAFVRVFLSALGTSCCFDYRMPVLSGCRPDDAARKRRRPAQDNVKRMLAYSSIAHAGYMLIGIVAARDAAGRKAAVLFYLAAYAIANLGAFGVMAALGTADDPHDETRDFAGLWHERPGMAGLMTVFLLSLGGFPPLVGFFAKWYIFAARSRSIWSRLPCSACSPASFPSSFTCASWS